MLPLGGTTCAPGLGVETPHPPHPPPCAMPGLQTKAQQKRLSSVTRLREREQEKRGGEGRTRVLKR